MQKFTALLTSFVAILCLSACHPQAPKAEQPDMPIPESHANSRSLQVAPFNEIIVKGPVDLEILASLPVQDLRLIADKDQLKHARAYVEGNILTVTVPESSSHKNALLVVRARDIFKIDYQGNGDVKAIGLDSAMLDVLTHTTGHVQLSGRRLGLNQLVLDGAGTVDIEGIHSKRLSIINRGHNVVHLNGEAALNHLTFAGEGWLSLRWVNAKHLTVEGKGSAYAQLAGAVDTLDVKLCDKAHFNGKYLRARKTYAKTYQHARADLQSTQVQYTLASDASNIYFYRTPNLKSHYMAYSGSVLPMM